MTTENADCSADSLETQLSDHINTIETYVVAALIADHINTDIEAAHGQLLKYVNEAHVALKLVGGHMRPGMRVLEIGSGIGVFASFLASRGHDVVEIEPIGSGFEFIGAARSVLSSDSGTTHLDISVDELDPDVHGHFDLIYSLNVLEHVPDWARALDAASGVLATPGTMIQSCPNYSVPYEPHFGIPLFPFRPQATSRVLPAKISQSGLWRSLNWVTMRSVRRWARQSGVTIEFEQGTLASALGRLSTDPEFEKRHGSVGATLAKLINHNSVRRVVRAIPAELATPMVFTVAR